MAEVAAGILDKEWGARQLSDGLDSLYALIGVARALGGIEGRKTVLYFAEGWRLPAENAPQIGRSTMRP